MKSKKTAESLKFIFNQHKEVIVEKTESDTLRLIRGYDITASESQQTRTYYHYVSDELGTVIYVDLSGYVCIVKEALYREARNQIDPETGDIYTAEKAYKLADEQWRNIERSQREYIAKQLQDDRKNTGRKLGYSKANQVIRTTLDAYKKN